MHTEARIHRLLMVLCCCLELCNVCIGHRPVFVRPNTTSAQHHERLVRQKRDAMADRRVPDEQRLYETIMDKYQQSVMPFVANATRPLVVSFSLRLNQIVTLDERKQVLTTNVFIDQTWIDPGLAWDPSDFMDVRALRIPADHVWLPDTFVYNNADGGSSGFMLGTYVQINSNGRVLWPVPLRLSSSCTVQITYFPFDSQMCMLKFGSWNYGLKHLDYKPTTDDMKLTVDPSTYVNNSEWELVSITMNRIVEDQQPLGIGAPLRKAGAHPVLTYVLHLKRNTFFYLFNIIVPCVMLSTLTLLTFWLPPISGEKVTLGLSVFLAFSMFMLLIAEEVPATSEAVPLIGVYLCMVMTMTSLSVIMAVVVTNLFHRGRKMRRAPQWMVTLCLDWLARPFCVLNDIPLIASTVDLTEHCQYDVSHKLPRPSAMSRLNPRTSDLFTSTNFTTTTSVVPTHLQNGGNPPRDANVTRDVTSWYEKGTKAGVSSHITRSSPSVLSTLFNGCNGGSGGERRVMKEVHPRARNSVTSSCHFTRIPTTGDDVDKDDDILISDDDERVMPKGMEEDDDDEVEVVWVKRQDVTDRLASETAELTGLVNGHREEDDDDTDDADDSELHNNDAHTPFGSQELVWKTNPAMRISPDRHSQAVDTEEVWNPRTQSVSTTLTQRPPNSASLPLNGNDRAATLTPRTCNTNTNTTTTPGMEVVNHRDITRRRSVDDDESSRTRRLLNEFTDTLEQEHHHHERRMSRFASMITLSNNLGRTMKTTLSSVFSTSKKLDPHPSSADLQAARIMIAEWQQIATVIDRLMFVVYVVVTIVAYIVILVIVPANQPPTTTAALGSAGADSFTQFWGG